MTELQHLLFLVVIGNWYAHVCGLYGLPLPISLGRMCFFSRNVSILRTGRLRGFLSSRLLTVLPGWWNGLAEACCQIAWHAWASLADPHNEIRQAKESDLCKMRFVMVTWAIKYGAQKTRKSTVCHLVGLETALARWATIQVNFFGFPCIEF